MGAVLTIAALLIVSAVFPPVGVIILAWMALSCIVNR